MRTSFFTAAVLTSMVILMTVDSASGVPLDPTGSSFLPIVQNAGSKLEKG